MVRSNEKKAVAALVAVVVLLAVQTGPVHGKGTPVDMEPTVREVVAAAIKSQPGIGPALVRLLFHDCWVNGCDGSVLLNNAPNSGPRGTEKNADSNLGVRGFNVIDVIKAKLGETVSCADIIVFAARDATNILSGGKINYEVSPGRMDSVISSAAAADATLPGSTFNFAQLKDNFALKNFTVEELVILSGAHSIGVAHYSSFKDRLDSTTATPIDANYSNTLKKDLFPQTGAAAATPQLGANPTEKNNIRDKSADFQSASGYNSTGVDTAARGFFDNSYYHANLQNMVLFRSDWELRTNIDAAKNLVEYRDDADLWNSDFAAAMAKLSDLKPPAGQYLEIRNTCSCVNN